MNCRIRSGRKRGVADNGFRVRMAMMRVRIYEAVVQKPPEAVRPKSRRIAFDHVATKLVDRDLKHQTNRLFRRL